MYFATYSEITIQFISKKISGFVLIRVASFEAILLTNMKFVCRHS